MTPPVVSSDDCDSRWRGDAGAGARGETFGWDNEYEIHTADVPAFEIDQYEVTNRQYLDFMAAGGYETRAFWSDEDWNWKTAQGISHPVFWTRKGDGVALSRDV